MKQEAFRFLMLHDLELVGCCPPPAVFTHEGQPLPLKLQIDLDVLARFPDADPVKLSRWLRLWTRRHNYLHEVCFGTDRYDLDGTPAGQISASHREHARKILVANRRKPVTAQDTTVATPVPRRPILSLPSMPRPTAA